MFDELSHTKFTEDEFVTLREVNKVREKRRLVISVRRLP
jgi:hypothetical protein